MLAVEPLVAGDSVPRRLGAGEDGGLGRHGDGGQNARSVIEPQRPGEDALEVGQAPILVSLLEGVAADAIHVDDDGAPRGLSGERGRGQQDGGPEARHPYSPPIAAVITALARSGRSWWC